MLSAASNQNAMGTSEQHKRLPFARHHAAESAALTASPFNPAWADQPALAIQRLPKLPDQATLMSEAFRDTRFPHQPTRRTLTDSIKLFTASGQLNVQQVQWMVQNRAYPNRLWSALEGIAPNLATDPANHITAGLNKTLTDLYPIREMSRFVTRWAKHFPDCIDPSLVTALVGAKRLCEQPANTGMAMSFDASVIESGMRKTLSQIVATLNERMKVTPHPEGKKRVDTPLRFADHLTLEGPIIIGADHMEGIDLPTGPDIDCSEPVWEAVKLALKTIQKHLLPMMLSPDVIETMMMMLEEADDDVIAIQNYLDAKGKEYDDLDAAEEAIDDLRSDLYYIEDAHHYREASESRSDRAATEDRWQTGTTDYLGALKSLLDSEVEPSSDREDALIDWCQKVLTTAQSACKGNDEPWWAIIEAETDHGTSPTILDQYTPVWLEYEHTIYETLNDQHVYMMQSGEDCEPLTLGWHCDPAVIIQWCDNIRAGMELLSDCLFLDHNNEKMHENS